MPGSAAFTTGADTDLAAVRSERGAAGPAADPDDAR